MDEVGLEPTMPEAEDLQSPGVTNFPTHPITWWTLKESNLTAATIHIKATVLQTAVWNRIQIISYTISSVYDKTNCSAMQLVPRQRR